MVPVVKNLPDNKGDIKRHRFNPWVRKIPWRRAWQTTPAFLHGGGAWWVTVYRVTVYRVTVYRLQSIGYSL